MAPKYKLTYFDIYWLGETSRYLFNYGGLEFEDHRIVGDDWPTLKASTPFGVLPTLEIDGKVYHQSTAICRYLAEILNIAGSTSNPLENLEVNQIADALGDLRKKTTEYWYARGTPEEEEVREKLLKTHIPFYFDRLEKIAKENNGHLALKKFTWVEIEFLSFMDSVSFLFGEKLLENYPTLAKITKDVAAIPNIKAYIEKRKPQTS